jgi:hypothetical protein
MVPKAGLEPAHLSMGDFESPASTYFAIWALSIGAGDGNRTHVLSLGSSGPAIERRPQSDYPKRHNRPQPIWAIAFMLTKIRVVAYVILFVSWSG